ncbi:hypothetical protein D3C80_1574350 [compost metagenome]
MVTAQLFEHLDQWPLTHHQLVSGPGLLHAPAVDGLHLTQAGGIEVQLLASRHHPALAMAVDLGTGLDHRQA